MKIFKDINKIPDTAKSAVVVIGNFDGVHKGHQVLLQKGREIAVRENKQLAVLTFEPHPRWLFRPDDPPFRITPAGIKQWRMSMEGVDTLFALEFNWDFASLTAEQFINDILIGGLGAAHVVIGYDFHFGQMRKGKPEHIATNLPTDIVDEVVEHSEDKKSKKISSSKIRQLLRHGKISEANTLLGWNWEIRGEVVKGDQRGRELGYPTANFALGDTVHPAYGVYAARVQVEGENKWHGAAINIGIRPMFEVKTAQVESFILDFDQEIYGKILRVQPIQYLRSEAKFETLNDLITQMDKDCELAREILKTQML